MNWLHTGGQAVPTAHYALDRLTVIQRWANVSSLLGSKNV